MKSDEQIAEEVAMRIEGKKPYRVWASETVYYSQIVWALTADEACDAVDPGDWGDPVDSQYFEITDAEPITFSED